MKPFSSNLDNYENNIMRVLVLQNETTNIEISFSKTFSRLQAVTPIGNVYINFITWENFKEMKIYFHYKVGYGAFLYLLKDNISYVGHLIGDMPNITITSMAVGHRFNYPYAENSSAIFKELVIEKEPKPIKYLKGSDL